jgi:two-component system OmpR family sensor kinase
MMRVMTTTTEMTDRRVAPSGWSVRSRITAAVALLVALALTGAGLLVYVLGLERVDQTVPQIVDQELAELDEFQANGIDPATGEPFTRLRPLVLEFLERNVPAPSEIMIGVWNDELKYSSPSPREAILEDPGFVDAVLDRGDTGGTTELETAWGQVYLEVQPLRDQEETGAFAVAYFVDDELVPLHRVLRNYAVAAVIALALVTSIAAWQAGRLLAPVRTLRDTAREISETDLSRRIPEVGNDDLSDLTRTFNAMLERLQQAFSGQRAFLDDAGHELRTPLTILRGHLELLDETDAEDVERTRELLLDEVDRRSGLVDDMILLTKADRPGFLSAAPLDVAALVDDVAAKVRGLGDRRWSVEARATGRADLDEQRLTQVLVQLSSNAVKHTGPGDEIALGSADGPDGAVRIWVRDTGPGVRDEDKAKIFTRFARAYGDRAAAAVRTDDGVGLGLSIVTAIVQAHGGSVHVEDARPTGACFVMTLPRQRKERSWPGS